MRTKHNPLVTVLRTIVLATCCLLVIGPFFMVVATSLADNQQIGRSAGLVLWPDNPNLNAYRAIIDGPRIRKALVVSVLVTLVGTFLSLLVSTMLAYALSRRGLVFGRFILFMVLGTLFFSPGMIPVYLTVRALGLLDTYAALIIPSLLTAFNVVVMRAFFMNLPEDLFEAAHIDGASEMGIFWRIVLPLSLPILVTMGLFYGVGYWNAWFNAQLYLNDASMHPLQMVMRQSLLGNSGGDSVQESLRPPQPALQMATLVISLIPIACVYPFLQKHFSKGMLTGAIKG